jgi:hypothetical protein
VRVREMMRRASELVGGWGGWVGGGGVGGWGGWGGGGCLFCEAWDLRGIALNVQ